MPGICATVPRVAALVAGPRVAAVVAVVGLMLGGCKQRNANESQANGRQGAAAKRSGASAAGGVDAAELKSLTAAFAPLPASMPRARGSEATPEKLDAAVAKARIELGRLLYFDPRLSKNHDVSCNSCHLLDRYGVDGKRVSPGHRSQLGERNSPSVYNAAGHFRQFWDGRAADVEEQAKGPILNPVEMASASESAVEDLLRSVPAYPERFAAAFPRDSLPQGKPSLSYANLARAIGAFERTLVTPGPWDDFLRGKRSALNAKQQAGLKAFVGNGCVACHNGAYLGGQSYQKLGNIKPWPNQKDQGRFALTKAESDRMMFKVPSLRNVAKTAPYFHDGSVATLKQAVEKMAWHQLGRRLPAGDVRSIVAFLEALTGRLPSAAAKAPKLPPSGPKTPKPDPS